MLKTTLIEFSAKDLIFVDKNSIVDKIDDAASKIGGAKSKIMIMPKFLFQSKLLIESNFGLGFPTFEAKLAFAILKQAFIEAPILYHFDPKCYICIKTDVLSYTIGKVFSELILNNLGR